MEFKRIIVLANSIKKGGRCVAGREIGEGKELSIGGWVRPISSESEGELMPRHMRMDNRPLKVLDIVDVPLASYADNQVHPEDWIVDSNAPWRRVGRWEKQRLIELQEHPTDLWLEDPARSDRALPAFLLKHRQPSLWLIQPTNFHVCLSTEYNRDKDYNQKRTRASFAYGEKPYYINLTDREFTDQYCRNHPKMDQPALTIRPPFADKCLLCVSLTPQFNGFHYKVVASVLELS